MLPYGNQSGDSGVREYALGADFIAVRFARKRELYLYAAARVGRHHVDRMKRLAVAGKGLSTYISQNRDVRNGYLKG